MGNFEIWKTGSGAGRLINRVQLTSDGFNAYYEAVLVNFGNDVDFAQLIKLHGVDPRIEEVEPDRAFGLASLARLGAGASGARPVVATMIRARTWSWK